MSDNIIDLKGATALERKTVMVILMTDYLELLSSMVKADYCDPTGYWKDHTPISRPIISAKEFIEKES